jgi:hypothetical protein
MLYMSMYVSNHDVNITLIVTVDKRGREKKIRWACPAREGLFATGDGGRGEPGVARSGGRVACSAASPRRGGTDVAGGAIGGGRLVRRLPAFRCARSRGSNRECPLLAVRCFSQ